MWVVIKGGLQRLLCKVIVNVRSQSTFVSGESDEAKYAAARIGGDTGRWCVA